MHHEPKKVKDNRDSDHDVMTCRESLNLQTHRRVKPQFTRMVQNADLSAQLVVDHDEIKSLMSDFHLEPDPFENRMGPGEAV